MNIKRIIYLDVIRIVGAFMVLYIHGGSFHQWEHEAMTLPVRILYMIPAVIVPSAVPLFMMISGSLLLKRDDTIKDIWNKRVRKVLLLILILTILHFIFDIFHGNNDFSKFVYRLINLEADNVAYWFMYWWLSFSIMLFCYQQIAKALDNEHIIYLLFFCILFNIVIPFINLFLGKSGIEILKFSNNLDIPLFVSSGFFYPFFGYYLDNRLSKNKVLNNTVFLIFIIVFSVMVTMFLNLYFKIDDTNMPARNVFTPIITVCIYLVIKNIFSSIDIKPDTKVYKIITFFGSNTIGVYCFQILFSMICNNTICSFIIKYVTNKKITSLLYMIISFICLSIITAMLKKVFSTLYPNVRHI